MDAPLRGAWLEVWTPLPHAEGPDGSWTAGGTQTVRVGCHVVHVDAGGRGTHHLVPA